MTTVPDNCRVGSHKRRCRNYQIIANPGKMQRQVMTFNAPAPGFIFLWRPKNREEIEFGIARRQERRVFQSRFNLAQYLFEIHDRSGFKIPLSTKDAAKQGVRRETLLAVHLLNGQPGSLMSILSDRGRQRADGSGNVMPVEALIAGKRKPGLALQIATEQIEEPLGRIQH